MGWKGVREDGGALEDDADAEVLAGEAPEPPHSSLSPERVRTAEDRMLIDILRGSKADRMICAGAIPKVDGSPFGRGRICAPARPLTWLLPCFIWRGMGTIRQPTNREYLNSETADRSRASR